MDGVEFWTPTSTRNPISIYQFKWLSYLSCIVQGKKTLFGQRPFMLMVVHNKTYN